MKFVLPKTAEIPPRSQRSQPALGEALGAEGGQMGLN